MLDTCLCCWSQSSTSPWASLSFLSWHLTKHRRSSKTKSCAPPSVSSKLLCCTAQRELWSNYGWADGLLWLLFPIGCKSCASYYLLPRLCYHPQTNPLVCLLHLVCLAFYVACFGAEIVVLPRVMLLCPGWRSGATSTYVLYNCNTSAEMGQMFYIKRASFTSKMHHMQIFCGLKYEQKLISYTSK